MLFVKISFKKYKEQLFTTPVLVLPKLSRKIHIYCDALTRIGLVLMQEGGKVAYECKTGEEA